ncbi:MAG: CRTAC1 family protein [Thermoanaerobaculia bacterium]|nr:CRTAC1 family protein [Thermoanaerobaculia bacterium]
MIARVVRLTVLAIVLMASLACESSVPAVSGVQGRQQVEDSLYFQDVSNASGLDFVHSNGMTGQLYLAEVIGGGAALVDYDNDGDLDLYLVQGGRLEVLRSNDPGSSVRSASPVDRLFRNEGVSTLGSPMFVDVTVEAGLKAAGYGMGVVAGDFDNDGWIDLYLTNFGVNQLWRNLGRDAAGTVGFEAVAKAGGAGDDGFSTSAAALDFDGDGWLDLYVANYVDYRLEDHRPCRSPSSRPDYCGPQNHPPSQDRLFRNLGPGEGDPIRFVDVTSVAGIVRERGNGLGVVSGDFDSDGLIDLYVANDLMRNLLWHNRGDGTFDNLALEWGAAVNAEGRAEASMGLAAADFDGDGDEDLFMTHLRGETNTAYRNDGSGGFEDVSMAMEASAASRPYTGFGVATLDLENDGDLDIVVANGDVLVIEERLIAGDPFPLGQRNQAFRNDGEGRFTEIPTERWGPAFSGLEVSRGLVAGDLDNDGDDDVVLTNNNGPAYVLLNRAADGSNWLGLRLIDHQRDALGAKVTVQLSDGRRLVRRVRTDGSYCSARDPRVLFGLGSATGVVGVEVEWVSRDTEYWPVAGSELAARRYHTLVRGEGRAGEPYHEGGR